MVREDDYYQEIYYKSKCGETAEIQIKVQELKT